MSSSGISTGFEDVAVDSFVDLIVFEDVIVGSSVDPIVFEDVRIGAMVPSDESEGACVPLTPITQLLQVTANKIF